MEGQGELPYVLAAFEAYGHGGILSLGRGARFASSREFPFMR